MLRINLLPIRQLKRRAAARNQIFVFLTLLVFLLCIFGVVAFYQSTKISTVNDRITELKNQKNKLAPVLKEITLLEQKKKDLESKTLIIKKLKQDSYITVHILDEVASKVDSKRMWLVSLKQAGSSLSMKGVALDNSSIAQFMDSLESSPYIGTVDLSNSSLSVVSGRNLKSFTLVCSVTSPEKVRAQQKNETTITQHTKK